ncbi:putative alpha-aspartyl dipeptidase [Glossina fuscipes fuscipes]
MVRSIFLLSSSKVHGYEFLRHAQEELTTFLKRNSVKTILFVPYAKITHDKYTETVSKALSPWGYKVEGIHVKKNPSDAIRSAEAIFIGGGNTFLLLKTLYDLNLVEVIRGAVLNNGIPYIGSSAGTNVATLSIHTTNDMPIVFPPTFDALKLVSFNINPHYLETDASKQHMGETRDERLNEFLEYQKRPVLGLREGTALIIYDDKVTLVGDRKAKLFKPECDPVEFDPPCDLSFLLKGN